MLSDDNGVTWEEVENHPVIPANIRWLGIATSEATPNLFYCELHANNSETVISFDTDQPTTTWATLVTNSHFADDIFGKANAFAVDQFNATSVMVGRNRDVEWYLGGTRMIYTGTPPAAGSHTTGHDDTEYIVAHPDQSGLFWVAHHGGVSLVTTSGVERDWEDRSDGLGVTEVWSMSTSQNKPDYVALGTFHDCNMITRTPYSAAWSPDWAYNGLYGDGTLSMINPKDANEVYIANQSGHWRRHDFAETTLSSQFSFHAPVPYHAKGAINRQHTNNLYHAELISNKLEIKRSNDGSPSNVL